MCSLCEKPDGKMDLCPSCGKNLAQQEHTCPFAEEINDDITSMCHCCADCQHECAMDI